MKDTRSRILEVTYELFCKHGAHVSLSQVSGALGIKKQSLYNYFPNKDALIIEMLQIKTQEYFDELMAFTDKNCDQPLHAFLKDFGHFCIRLNRSSGHIYLRRWISVTVSTDDFPSILNLINDLGKKYTSRLLSLFEQAKTRGEVHSDVGIYHVNLYSISLRGIMNEFVSIQSESEAIDFYNKFYKDFWNSISN